MQHSAGKLNEFISWLVEIFVSEHCGCLFSECPEFGIPQLNPYKFSKPFVPPLLKLTSQLTSQISWSGIETFGVDKSIIQEIRYTHWRQRFWEYFISIWIIFMAISYFHSSGLQPNETVTSIRINILIPKASYHMNTSGVWKVFAMSFNSQGSAIISFGMCVVAYCANIMLQVKITFRLFLSRNRKSWIYNRFENYCCSTQWQSLHEHKQHVHH